MCPLSDVDQLWIGLHDTDMQMDFQWTDHTPVIFTYWHPFEPNNFRNTQEDCVSIWGAVSDPRTLTLTPKAWDLNHLTVTDSRCQRVSSVCIYLAAVFPLSVCVLLTCAGGPLG